MIFQDPFKSLNPNMTIEQIIQEPMIIHKLDKISLIAGCDVVVTEDRLNNFRILGL